MIFKVTLVLRYSGGSIKSPHCLQAYHVAMLENTSIVTFGIDEIRKGQAACAISRTLPEHALVLSMRASGRGARVGKHTLSALSA